MIFCIKIALIPVQPQVLRHDFGGQGSDEDIVRIHQ